MIRRTNTNIPEGAHCFWNTNNMPIVMSTTARLRFPIRVRGFLPTRVRTATVPIVAIS